MRKYGPFKRRYSRRQRKTYVPQELRLANPRSPYASKYGDECFVKVQAVVPLTTDVAGNVFSIMRQDNPTSNANNIVPFDQAEFVPFLGLYGFYEIRGMKAEMTVSDAVRCVGSGLYAGMAPNLVFPASTPNNVDLVKLPIQTKGNVQG